MSAAPADVIQAALPWRTYASYGKKFCLQEAEALLCVLGGYKSLDELVHDLEEKQWGPCTRTWRAGATAYRCETCQVTESSAICAKCYLGGGHKMHQSYSYVSPTGGCCDCGDLTGWQEAGCCPAHRPPAEAQPLVMDLPLQLALKLVFYAAFVRIKEILGEGRLTWISAQGRAAASQECCQIAQFVSRICAAAPVRAVASACTSGTMKDMFQVHKDLENRLHEASFEDAGEGRMTGTGSKQYQEFKPEHWRDPNDNIISVLARDVFFCNNEEMLEELCVMVIVLSYETALRRPYGITFLASYPSIHRSLIDWAGRGLSWPARMRLDRIAAQVYNEQGLLVELVENHRLLDVYLKEMEFMLDYACKYSEDASQAKCEYLFHNGCQRVLLDLGMAVCHVEVAALLLGNRERLGLLFDALQKLHLTAPFKRAQGTHVEYEANGWRFMQDLEDELLVIVLSPLLLVMAAQPARGSVNKDCATLTLARRLDLLHVATMEAISRTWDVVHERPPQHEPREIYDQLLSGAPVSIHLPLHHLAARLTCLLIATQDNSGKCTCEEEADRWQREADEGQSNPDEDLEELCRRRSPTSLFDCSVHKQLGRPNYIRIWEDLAFHPLQSVVYLAQIRLGLWARNGLGLQELPARCCKAPASEHTLLPNLALLQIWFQATSDEPDRALGEFVSAFGGKFLVDAARRRLPSPPPPSFKVARTVSGTPLGRNSLDLGSRSMARTVSGTPIGRTSLDISTPPRGCAASNFPMPGVAGTPGTPPAPALALPTDDVDDCEPPSPHSTRRPTAGALQRQADLAASLRPFMAAFPHLSDGKEVWDNDLRQVPDESRLAVTAAGLHTLVVLLRERSLWQKNCKAWMRRDVVAWLAVMDMGFSDLAKLLLHICPVEPLLTEVLDEVAEVVPADNQSNRRYKLRKEAWADFDPYFARYTPEHLNLALERATASKWVPGWQLDPPGLPWPFPMADLPKFLLTPLLHRLISSMLGVAKYNARNRSTHSLAVSAMYLLAATVEYLQQCHQADKDIAASTSSLAGVLESWAGCGPGILQLLQDITLCEEFNVEVRQQATKVREMVADIVIPLARSLGTPHVEHLARSISNLSATPSLGDGAGTSDLEARREAARRQQAIAMEQMRQAQAEIVFEDSDSENMEDADNEDLPPDVPRYDARRFGKITGICALCHEGNEKEALGWVGHAHVCAVPSFASRPAPCWQDIGSGLPPSHASQETAPARFMIPTRCVTDGCPGLHLRCCSHLMHHSCVFRHRKPLSAGGESDDEEDLLDTPRGIDPKQGEFLCPLCRRVSNVLLPALLPDPPDALAHPSCAPNLGHAMSGNVLLDTKAETSCTAPHQEQEGPSTTDAPGELPGPAEPPDSVPMTLSAVLLAAYESANDTMACDGLRRGEQSYNGDGGSGEPDTQPVQSARNRVLIPEREMMTLRVGPAVDLAAMFVDIDVITPAYLYTHVEQPIAASAATQLDNRQRERLLQLPPELDSDDDLASISSDVMSVDSGYSSGSCPAVDEADGFEAEVATSVLADLQMTDMSLRGRHGDGIVPSTTSRGTSPTAPVPVPDTGPAEVAGLGRAEATQPHMGLIESSRPAGIDGAGPREGDAVFEPDVADRDAAGAADRALAIPMDLGVGRGPGGGKARPASVGGGGVKHDIASADKALAMNTLWATLAHHVSHWEIVRRGTPPYAALSRTVSAGGTNWDPAPADVADWRAAANLAVLCQAYGCGVLFQSAGFGLSVLQNAVAWLGGSRLVMDGGPWIIISRGWMHRSPANVRDCQPPARTLLDHIVGPANGSRQQPQDGGDWALLTGDPVALLLAMYSLALNDDSGWHDNGAQQGRTADPDRAFKALLALVYHMAAAQALVCSFAQVSDVPPLASEAPLSSFYAVALAAFDDPSHPAHTQVEQATFASLLPFLRQTTLLKILFGIDAPPTADWTVPDASVLCPLGSDGSWAAAARTLALALGLPEPADALRAVVNYPDVHAGAGLGLTSPGTEQSTLEETLRRWLGSVAWETPGGAPGVGGPRPPLTGHANGAAPHAPGLGVGHPHASPSNQLIQAKQFWLDTEALGKALRLAVDSPPSLLELPGIFQDLAIQCQDATCAKCGCAPPNKRALCLLCGTIFCVGNPSCPKAKGNSHCVNHAITCGGGTALFLLMPHTKVLVVRGSRVRWLPSPYLDEHDEEDFMLKRGRPLHLVPARLARAAATWRVAALDFGILPAEDLPFEDLAELS